MFTPFFTTKSDGQGIGLTLVREVLTRHCFGFSLSSAEAGSTRFAITFPRDAGVPSANPSRQR